MPFVALLKAYGINHIPLLKRAGLPLNCLDDPETFIPVVCSGEFRKLAAQKIGDPNISLKASRNIKIENLGKFGQVLMQAPTLHASLRNMRDFVATESSNLIMELHPQANGDL